MKEVAAKTQTMSNVAHSANTTPLSVRHLRDVHPVNTASFKPGTVDQTGEQAVNDPIPPAISSRSPFPSPLVSRTSSTPIPRLKTILYEQMNTPTAPLPPTAQVLTDAVHPSNLRNTLDISLDDKDKPDEEKSLTWQNSRAWRDYARSMSPFESTQEKLGQNKEEDASFGRAIKSRVIISSAIIVLTLLVLAILITSLVLGKVGA